MDRRKLLLVVAAVIAVLGVALVFVYAKGADKRAAEKFDTVEVLVANKKINPGESFDEALESGKFELADVAQGQVLDGAGRRVRPVRGLGRADRRLSGRTADPGEVRRPSSRSRPQTTLPIPEGKIAISIAVKDDGRVGYFVRAGRRGRRHLHLIDRRAWSPTITRVLLERVTVLAAGSTTSLNGSGNENASAEDARGRAERGGIKQLLTIAVTQRRAEQVRFAEKAGELTAALLNDASNVEAGRGRRRRETLLED